ncbi:MAG TPA: hypothetical protein VGE14_11290 [Marmoricola sp.]
MRPLGAAVGITLSGFLLLSACGSDTTPTAADDPTPSATPSSPSPSPSEPSSEPSSEPPPSTTSSTPAEPAVPGEEAAATGFRAFARGDAGLPPLAGQVDLYLGNAFTGFVTQKRAGDAKAWATCTEVGDYAGRACPLSPLDVLAEHRRVAYVESPDSTCLKTYGPVPPDLRKLVHVAIVPAPGSVDSCIDDFAVQLFSNADGELVAVSLLMGEP